MSRILTVRSSFGWQDGMGGAWNGLLAGVRILLRGSEWRDVCWKAGNFDLHSVTILLYWRGH